MARFDQGGGCSCGLYGVCCCGQDAPTKVPPLSGRHAHMVIMDDVEPALPFKEIEIRPCVPVVRAVAPKFIVVVGDAGAVVGASVADLTSPFGKEVVTNVAAGKIPVEWVEDRIVRPPEDWKINWWTGCYEPLGEGEVAGEEYSKDTLPGWTYNGTFFTKEGS